MVDKNAIKAVFENAMKLKHTESCLIVTDTIKEPIARAFYEYALTISPKVEIIVMDPTLEHAAEPPQFVSNEMLKYDVQLLITKKSLTHTNARINATKKGARVATMPDITEDIANRCLDIDYMALKERSIRLSCLLQQTKKVRVTTRLGTDIMFELGGKEFFGEDGGMLDYPGSYGNLPEGEIAFAPKTCTGTYIVDASFPDIGVLSSPITFGVVFGKVKEITGEAANKVKERLDRVGQRAYRVAELGIGLNPKAKIIGNILEDEKVIGTVHIAVGNNLFGGGTNDVPLHLDGVITSPSISFDEKLIMKDGKFVIDQGMNI